VPALRIVHLTWGSALAVETMLCDLAGEQAAAHETWIIVGNRDIDASIASSLDRSCGCSPWVGHRQREPVVSL